MPIEVRCARSTSDLDQMMQLRYRVYVEDEARFDPTLFPERRIFDRFDSYDVTTNLIALVDGEPAGFLRMTQESELGSPLDEHYELSELRAGCGAQIATVSMLGVRRSVRDRGVAQALMQSCIRRLHAEQYTDVIVVINAEIRSMLERFSLKKVGEPFYCPRVNQLLIRMRGKVAQLPRFDTREPEGLPQGGRMLFADGETLFRQGDVGGSAWYITRGKVRLTVEALGEAQRPIAQVGPEELVGELELVSSHRRLFTARACGSVEAIQIHSAGLVQQLAKRSDSVQSDSLQKMLAGATRHVEEIVNSLHQAPVPSGIRLFNDYLACRVVHLLNELRFFELLEDREAFDCAEMAERMGIGLAHLKAMLVYLVRAGVLSGSGDTFQLSRAHRTTLMEEAGFIHWLLGAYDPMLDGLQSLVTGQARYGHTVKRNDREVARSSAAISRVYTDPYMYELLRLEGVQTIADIGTGSAVRLVEICKRFPTLQAFGLDISPECCRLAQENVVSAGMQERIRIVCARAEEWLIKARQENLAQVDLVMCFAMFHDLLNVPGLAERFLADLVQGLRPGSFILIQDQMQLPPGHSSHNWVSGFELVHHFMGQKLFPRAVYEQILRSSGLTIVSCVDTPIPENCLFLCKIP